MLSGVGGGLLMDTQFCLIGKIECAGKRTGVGPPGRMTNPSARWDCGFFKVPFPKRQMVADFSLCFPKVINYRPV